MYLVGSFVNLKLEACLPCRVWDLLGVGVCNLSQVIFVFLLFLGYADKVETRET